MNEFKRRRMGFYAVRVWQSECGCVALTTKSNVFSSRAEKYATKIVKMA